MGVGVSLPLPLQAHVYKPGVWGGTIFDEQMWEMGPRSSALTPLTQNLSIQTNTTWKCTGQRRATVTMPAVKSHSVTSFRHFKSFVCQTSWNLMEQICDAHRSRAWLLSLNSLILNQIISVLTTRRDKQSKKRDIALTSGGPGSFPSAISTFSSCSM